jgi:hypothetical protein
MKQIGEKKACMAIPITIKYSLSGSLKIVEGPIRVKPIAETKK